MGTLGLKMKEILGKGARRPTEPKAQTSGGRVEGGPGAQTPGGEREESGERREEKGEEEEEEKGKGEERREGEESESPPRPGSPRRYIISMWDAVRAMPIK